MAHAVLARTPLAPLLDDLTWPQRLLLWLLWGGLLGPLLLALQRRRPAGAPRLAAAAPVMALNMLAPLLFEGEAEVLSCFTAAVATSMLANLKVLAWVLNRGPLLVRPLSLPQFVAVVSLPVIPSAAPTLEGPETAGGDEGDEAADSQAKRGRKGRIHERESVPTLVARFARKCVGLAAVVWALLTFDLPLVPRVIVQSFSMVMILSIASDGIGAGVSTLLRLPLSPHFENIYLSTSAADFWNRRWNQIVSGLLRATVYDPAMEGRLVHREGAPAARFSRARRMLAVLASFVVSGLLHEMLICFPTGHASAGLLWFWHFTLWGVIIVAENVGRRLLSKRGVTVPRWLANVLFLTLLHVMLGAFWLPPLNREGIIQRGAANIAETWSLIGRALLPGSGGARGGKEL